MRQLKPEVVEQRKKSLLQWAIHYYIKTSRPVSSAAVAEEAGMEPGRLLRLTTIFTTPGFTDERIHLYLASGLSPVALAREADEFITVHQKRWSEVGRMIRKGKIRDGKSLAALMYVNCFVRT